MAHYDSASRARAAVDALYRADSRRVLATLIRLLGSFELAEDALHDGFAAAVEQWPRDGVPENPRAWLISAGRFKAIDSIRRRARFDVALQERADLLEAESSDSAGGADGLEDDRLRLIFTCCHPALPSNAQVALTLREICDLTTEEIAHAFLIPASSSIRCKRRLPPCMRRRPARPSPTGHRSSDFMMCWCGQNLHP